MKFSERLKLLRTDRSVTQTDVAGILNVGRSTIAGYETKGKQPDYDKLIKLSKYFDVSIDYLLGNTDQTKVEEDIELTKQENLKFNNPKDALKFILEQPVIMNHVGYELSDITEEEMLGIINDILLTIRISIERLKNKS